MRSLLCLLAVLVVVHAATAQEAGTIQAFENHGVKVFNRINLRYLSPVAVTGVLQTTQVCSTDTISTAFTGNLRQGRIFATFQNPPPLMGPETEWTTRPWVLKNGATRDATLHIPVRSRIVNSTGQYRNTDFVFVSAASR